MHPGERRPLHYTSPSLKFEVLREQPITTRRTENSKIPHSRSKNTQKSTVQKNSNWTKNCADEHMTCTGGILTDTVRKSR